jgi:ubiquinone/menaquinone biosynthesis C-methylase UbiE
MNDIKKLYEEKFNTVGSKVKVDQSWNRYYNNKNCISYQRFMYCISKLYGNVLDVGSADGFGAYLMSKNINIKHITCLEIQDKAIKEAKKNLKGIYNIEIVKGIAEEISYFDNSFDSVFCGETLEHVFDDVQTVKEIYRVVKDLVIFSIPIKGGISLQHVREYTLEEFDNLIEKYFKIVSIKLFINEKNIKELVIECKKI